MKKCTKCNQSFPLEEFPIRNKTKGIRNSMCKECKKEYDREWYDKNKSRIQPIKHTQQKERYNRNRKFLIDYLKTHACVDCGETNFIVLEFDHKDGVDKLFALGESRLHSLETLKKEIAKCDVRCANCHKIRTAKQRNYYQMAN